MGAFFFQESSLLLICPFGESNPNTSLCKPRWAVLFCSSIETMHVSLVSKQLPRCRSFRFQPRPMMANPNTRGEPHCPLVVCIICTITISIFILGLGGGGEEKDDVFLCENEDFLLFSTGRCLGRLHFLYSELICFCMIVFGISGERTRGTTVPRVPRPRYIVLYPPFGGGRGGR